MGFNRDERIKLIGKFQYQAKEAFELALHSVTQREMVEVNKPSIPDFSKAAVRMQMTERLIADFTTRLVTIESENRKEEAAFQKPAEKKDGSL